MGAHARKGLLRWWGSAFCNTQNHRNHGSTSFKKRKKEWDRVLERGGTSGFTIREEGGGNRTARHARACWGKGVGWLFLTHISIFHEICCTPMQVSEIQSASLAIIPTVARRCKYPKSKAHLLLGIMHDIYFKSPAVQSPVWTSRKLCCMEYGEEQKHSTACLWPT